MKFISASTAVFVVTALFIVVGCSESRPLESVKINEATIKQAVVGDDLIVQVRVPDASINSAKYPVTKKEEVGYDVIIVSISTAKLLPLVTPKQDEEIKLARTKGKNYKVLARDSDGSLHYVTEFIME